jgi:hypothetical protein
MRTSKITGYKRSKLSRATSSSITRAEGFPRLRKMLMENKNATRINSIITPDMLYLKMKRERCINN